MLSLILLLLYSFIIQDCVNAQSCEYCSLRGQRTLDNTYCRNPSRSRSCGQVFYSDVNADEISQILKLHNDIRRKIANGQDSNFRYTASDMQELMWDDELAHGARLWAEQCDFNHDSNDVCRFRVGQNLYISGTRSTSKTDWNKPVSSWYDEVHMYRGSPTNVNSGSLSGVGHFTQMIWAETKYIGCHFIGHTGYPGNPRFNSEYYVCNYGPAGNFIGRTMLKPGSACSGCQAGQQCNNGLCADTKQVAPLPGITAPLPGFPNTKPTFPTQRPNIPTSPPFIPTLNIPITTTTTTTTMAPVQKVGCEIKKVTDYLEYCYSTPAKKQGCEIKKVTDYLEYCYS